MQMLVRDGLRRLEAADLRGKRVLVRVDINVPYRDSKVLDDTRIRSIRPTVEAIISAGGWVVLASHLGRPGGRPVDSLSLRHLVPSLEACLGRDVVFRDIMRPDGIGDDGSPNSLVLLENLRFHPGETDNSTEFSRSLAQWGDIFCNDAFAVSHRAHASTAGITRFLDSYTGYLMEKELNALSDFTERPARPLAAIVGGAKISTKINLLGQLARLVDILFIGGGMANTFFMALDHPVGRSLVETAHVEDAREIIEMSAGHDCQLLLPTEIVTSTDIEGKGEIRTLPAGRCPSDHMILDAGIGGMNTLEEMLGSCGSVIWNGPIGAFEFPPFDRASIRLARCIGDLTASGKLQSLAGGGETLAAIARAGVSGEFSHLSTGGGAFLEYLQGSTLPGIKALMRS